MNLGQILLPKIIYNFLQRSDTGVDKYTLFIV